MTLLVSRAVRYGLLGLFAVVLLCMPAGKTAADEAFSPNPAPPNGALSPLQPQGTQLFSLAPELELSPPILRILYTASTWGETKPCPTCRTAYGGLDRRAALFNALRKDPVPLLIIAGPDEFLADAARFTNGQKANHLQTDAPPFEDARKSLAAHMLLNVNAGFLSPRAADWLTKGAGAIPPGFAPVSKTPVTRLVPGPAGTVGIVFFPYGQGDSGAPTEKQKQQVLEAGNGLKQKSVLLLGVSPWGYDVEKKILRRVEGLFHILLGGGDGMPFAQAIAQDCPAVLWSRPDSMGRAVTEIRLMELPPPSVSGKRMQWLEGVTFKAGLVFLDDGRPSDPEMLQILQ